MMGNLVKFIFFFRIVEVFFIHIEFIHFKMAESNIHRTLLSVILQNPKDQSLIDLCGDALSLVDEQPENNQAIDMAMKIISSHLEKIKKVNKISSDSQLTTITSSPVASIHDIATNIVEEHLETPKKKTWAELDAESDDEEEEVNSGNKEVEPDNQVSLSYALVATQKLTNHEESFIPIESKKKQKKSVKDTKNPLKDTILLSKDSAIEVAVHDLFQLINESAKNLQTNPDTVLKIRLKKSEKKFHLQSLIEILDGYRLDIRIFFFQSSHGQKDPHILMYIGQNILPFNFDKGLIKKIKLRYVSLFHLSKYISKKGNTHKLQEEIKEIINDPELHINIDLDYFKQKGIWVAIP
jgi:hypothetical protein